MTEKVETDICPPRAKELLDHIIGKLNTDCTRLIGRNFSISAPKYEITTPEEFITQNDCDFYMFKSELKDSYEGHIFTIFQLKSTIEIGGTLLGSDEKQINEKITKKNLDVELADGANEFGNQFSGIIDSVLRKRLTKPVQLKLSSCASLERDNAKKVFAGLDKDEYLHLSSFLIIEGYETGKFNMLIPIYLVEAFYEEQIHKTNTNVLVLDDSLTDIKIIKKYLANTGFRLLSANNLKEAYTILHTEKIHLILIDLVMPKEDGITVYRQIRKTPYTRGIPTIMISAKPTKVAVMDSLKAGIKDFLVKPFNKEKLLKRIDKYKVKEKPESMFC